GVIEDRMLWGGFIQLGLRREAHLVEASREGVMDDDPFALGCLRGAFADVLEDVLERLENVQRCFQFAGGSAERMGMAVIEAGQDGLALEIDDAGFWTFESTKVFTIVNNNDSAILDRDRVKDLELLVNGDDVDMVQDQDSRLGRDKRTGRQQQDE